MKLHRIYGVAIPDPIPAREPVTARSTLLDVLNPWNWVIPSKIRGESIIIINMRIVRTGGSAMSNIIIPRGIERTREG